MLTRTNRPRNVWALGPFSEVQNELERFVNDLWGANGNEGLNYSLDIHEDKDHIRVEAELPGLSKDDIEVTLEDGVMTISGEKKWERLSEEPKYHVRERRFGKFSRSFQIPSTVDESTIHATLKDGILHVTLNKREEVKPRRIDVNVK